MSKGLGAVATIIVHQGELKVGDPVVIGTECGKVRILRDSRGRSLTSALPGQHAVIAGLRGLPAAGDELQVVDSEEKAQKIARARGERVVEYRRSQLAKMQRAAQVKESVEAEVEQKR
jgi:translation initiation factor IF-2